MKRGSLYLLAMLALLPGCDTGVSPAVVTQLPGAAILVDSGNIVETAVEQALMRDGAADYLVYFDSRPDLSAAGKMDWNARGRFVMESLQKAAAKSQADAITVLKANNVKFQSFWIDNVIAVTKSDRATLNSISALPGVTRVIAPRKLGIIEPEKREVSVNAGVTAVESNIDHVGAPGAWGMGYDGSGIVVANIDTGVRYTHSVLVDHYRGNNGGTFDHEYNWYDPYTFSTAPLDGHGHGTHTMGTVVGADSTGTNQTGMAPGARWIACRGCDTSSCTDVNLLACAQWVAAPTDLSGNNPNPDARPHVVNNSWGDCGTGYDNWYQGVVDAWHAVGIYPVFSNGNASNCGYSEPPGCNTVGNPARYGNVTGVGSTTQSSGEYATHSNWGPTDNPDTINPQADPIIKPQVVAPGENIRSSVASGDNSFESWGGTSMSAPHVTGLLALVWQAAPCLIGNYAQTETLMEMTATPIPYASSCGGEGPGNVPNNATGWGEINAVALIQLASEACGPSGSISGTVTDQDGMPVFNATVTVGTHAVKTDESGWYRIDWVPVGVYDVVATSFWYETSTVTGVEVLEDTETPQDITMTALPRVSISGVVRDGSGHGWPLYAKIVIVPPDDSAAQVVFSQPFTGVWSAEVIAGAEFTYEVYPWLPEYAETVIDFTAITDPATLDLPVPVVSCDMTGYMTVYSNILTTDFEADNGGFVPSGVTTFAWGAPTSGPGVAYSGSNVWATNLAGNYNHGENGLLTMPDIDASAAVGGVSLSWWHYLNSEGGYDYASVEVSNDGGTEWITVWGPVSGGVASSWTQVLVELGGDYAVSNLKIRFRFTSDSSVAFPGWYIDDVAVMGSLCVLTPAGVVGGFAYDTSNGLGMNDVLVDIGGKQVLTAATPEDPLLDDGLWFQIAPTGPVTVVGTHYGYNRAEILTGVVADNASWRDIPMVPGTPVRVSGRVTDGNGHGWPLYAYIVLTSTDFGDQFLAFSDPFTGEWAADLYSGYSYTANVYPFIPGYDDPNLTFIVDPDMPVQDFPLVSSGCNSWGMDPDTCLLVPGGLVGGYVNEISTGDPLLHVPVWSGTSPTWNSIDTPWDPAVDDGLYFVFASGVDWPDAQAQIQADAPGMTPYMETIPAPWDAFTRHDIGIGEAKFQYSPTDLVFEFLSGQSGVQTVSLSNHGTGSGDYELAERNGGAATTAVGPRILTYYATLDGSSSGDPLALALQDLGYGATAFYNDNHSAFLDALNNQEWDVVVYDGSVNCDPTLFDPLLTYVQNGGKLVFYCWQFRDSYKDHPLAAALGVSIVGSVVSPLPTYSWDGGLFSFLEMVPDLTEPVDTGIGLSGFVADPVGSGVAIAGSTVAPAPGTASIIMANDGRTVWRGMNDYSNPGDVDLDGQMDTMELWMNTIEFLVTGGATDVPWLSELPTTGTIQPGSADSIMVTADSTGMAFGTYTAQVMARTPNSRTAPAPLTVTMEVGHLMTVVQAEHGTIAPAGETFVRHNGSVELWFAADDGYHVQDVIINGVSYGRHDYMLVEGVQEDLLVTAWFEFTCYTHDDCTHANNDCVGVCEVDTCDRLEVKPEGWACGDQADTLCSNPNTCNDAGICLANHEPSTVACRASEGECDTMDYCTGVSDDCPDVKLTTQCREDKGLCDVADFCNGVDNNCPTDAKEPVTTQCRDLQGVCDVPDFCNGVDDACPTDVKLPVTEVCRSAMGECDKMDFCNGVDSFCPTDEKLTVECRASEGVCDKADFCNGVDNRCPADEKLTTECRQSFGDCDVAEVCNGVDNLCPVDQKLPPTTECRESEGVCDKADFCNGMDNACPADEKLTVECRASEGVCDKADFCNGVDNGCPIDEKLTVECRGSRGECDVADFCDGVADDCPVDAKSVDECRESEGVCDAADFCNGVDDACPPDVKLRTECRESEGVCDKADFCNGADNDCPADEKLTVECRESDGICDKADFCDGVANDCPVDEKLPATVICQGAQGLCDAVEFCTGADNDCPADLKLTIECRAPRGDCDLADFCNGTDNDCPADNKSTFLCRSSAGECDKSESCDGAGNLCPPDEKLTTECRAADGDCDVAEVCNGTDNTCPFDQKLPPTTECRESEGVCDKADFCTGLDNECPADEKLTVECRESAGACDIADFCNGADNECPEDVKSREECRAAAGVCDAPDYCDGADDACPADAKLTIECRAVAGVCDIAEACDGVADECPVDVFSAVATCDDGNACTSDDRCDGTGAACKSDAFTCQPGPCDESVECDGEGGCIPTFKTVGTECDDGMDCTTGETCQVGGQCVAETVLTCDEPPHAECVDADTSKVYAPEGICSADAEGCDYESRLFACESGCDDETGLCTETDVDCTDLTAPQCTVATGYPAWDRDNDDVACYYKPLPAGTSCDDGEECIINEACDGNGACVGEANPVCGVPRDVIEDNGGEEDTVVVQDTTGTDTAGEDLGPQNTCDDGCTAGTGSGTHVGWLMLILGVAFLAIVRRRRAA